MKKWALLVAILYGLILTVIAWPIIASAFIPLEVKGDIITITKSEVLKSFSSIDFKGFLSWQFLAALTIMVVGQLALLVVPVDIAEKRPVAKRRLVFPIVASGLMMALLITGLVVSTSEFLVRGRERAGLTLFALAGQDSAADLKEVFSEPTFIRAICVFIFAWLLWALVFFRWTRKLKPEGLIEKQCRLLYRGSILEMLVAVPTHVIARSRDYCCAGASTFVGIVLGISVMLFSFGPGVFFLFADRWKKIHPKN